MDFIVARVQEAYGQLLESGDSRVQSWPLVNSPFPTMAICLSYAFFVNKIGPRLMKNRKPLDIRWLMVAYNLIMVGISSYLFYGLGVYGWFGKYDYRCQPVDYTDSKDAIGMASFAWYYYITKFIEFADTLFFVMRKKFDHISTLHVVHHGIMPMSVWWGMKYAPGGHSSFFGFINSFVHIPMYLYYGLSAIGPHMSKYLFWKRYMTTLQMVQFVAIFVHSFQLLFRDCDYPRGFVYWIGSHAVLFWFLFWDFFKKTYLTSSSTRQRERQREEKEREREERESEVAQHRSQFPVCFGQTDTLIGLMNSKSNGEANGVVKNGRSNGMNDGMNRMNDGMNRMNNGMNGPTTRLNTAPNGLGKERASGDHDGENSKSRKLD